MQQANYPTTGRTGMSANLSNTCRWIVTFDGENNKIAAGGPCRKVCS